MTHPKDARRPPAPPFPSPEQFQAALAQIKITKCDRAGCTSQVNIKGDYPQVVDALRAKGWRVTPKAFSAEPLKDAGTICPTCAGLDHEA